MLWWFLILGVSTAVVVSVALSLYMRVRRQMKQSAARRAQVDDHDRLDNDRLDNFESPDQWSPPEP
jgi:MFS superfamily sulfate permease-like transporter